ncbi:MAG: LpxI family protein [Hyphomicrobiaceae bacterium]
MISETRKHERLNSKPTGILAGGGQLPIDIADAIQRTGRDPHIIALDGVADSAVERYSHDRVGLGQLGKIISRLRARGCEELVIAGHLARPDLFGLRTDLGFFRHLPRIIRLMRGGDDSVLRKVIRFFEEQGFEIVGIPDVAPGLLAAEGHLTSQAAIDHALADARIGLSLVATLGPLDVGQAVVVRDGQVLAVEAAEGTDGLLQRLPGTTNGARRGVLVKASKPGQDLRIDLPTVGATTVGECTTAGLAAIAVEAGRSVIAERTSTLEVAEQHGVAIIGLPSQPPRRGQPEALASHSTPIALLSRTRPKGPILRDVRKGLATIHALAQFASQQAAIVSRENVLAIGVGEPVDQLAQRSLTVRQWSDRKNRRRRGVLVVMNEDLLDDDALTAVNQARLRGIVIARPTKADQLERQVRYANDNGLFLVVQSA